MEGIRFHYSALYRDFSRTPELAKFRRYLEYWSWILYNKSSDIDKQIDEFNGLIAAIHGFPRERSLFTVTDYHRAYDQAEHPFLKVKVENLEKSIRRYSKDLLTAHAVANLPDQCDIYARHFAQYHSVFADGVFGPTKEDAGIYRQVPSHAEMCSLKDLDQQDPFTAFVVRHLKFMNMCLTALAGRISKKPKQRQEATSQQYVELDTVLMVMDLLTVIYVPLLFAGCMGVLSCIKSEKARIVVLGAFGLLLTTSLVLCVPKLRRSDLFAVTAAFFAVGGIYIGAKSVDKR